MNKEAFIFDRKNYILVIVGIAFVALGFLLMAGGGSDDPNVFNEEIFNAQRITWAPLMVILGLAIELFAIMRRPKEDSEA